MQVDYQMFSEGKAIFWNFVSSFDLDFYVQVVYF